MYQTVLSPEAAIGYILRHNIADAHGHKALPKGRRLTSDDIATLHQLGVVAVHVAVFEPGDIHEDEAARRVAVALCGANIATTAPAASRVNAIAATQGIAAIDIDGLLQANSIDGITIATRPNHSRIDARQRVATIKIIPFALPEAALAQIEALGAARGPVIALRPLQPHLVGIVLVGSEAARTRITHGVHPAIEGRIVALGSTVLETRYVAPDEASIATALQATLALGAQLVIIAGETSIMDRDDVTPRAIRMAGGSVEHYGAPVEPGNLLLMAYSAEGVALLGAPGCVRSRDVNIVDLVLPRLLAGEQITKADIIALGHGGLL